MTTFHYWVATSPVSMARVVTTRSVVITLRVMALRLPVDHPKSETDKVRRIVKRNSCTLQHSFSGESDEKT
jgi:hypothetical protein